MQFFYQKNSKNASLNTELRESATLAPVKKEETTSVNLITSQDNGGEYSKWFNKFTVIGSSFGRNFLKHLIGNESESKKEMQVNTFSKNNGSEGSLWKTDEACSIDFIRYTSALLMKTNFNGREVRGLL